MYNLDALDQPKSSESRGLEIVAGQKDVVALWLLERIPYCTALPGGFEAIGVARDGALCGGTLYTNYRPWLNGGDVEMWAGGQGWLSRRIISELLGYPFNQLNCHRITAVTPKNNKPSRGLLEGLGFRLEGIARQGFGLRSHACIYGLLRGESRWLKR